MSTVIGFTISITGSKEATAEAEALRRKIAEVQAGLKSATDVKDMERLGKELVDLKAKQNEVNKVVRDQVKAREDELRTARGAANTYEGLSRRLTVLRASYKDLAAAEQDTTDEAKELLSEIVKLDTKLKSIDGSVGQFQRNVGNYGSAFDVLNPKLAGFRNEIADVGKTLKVGGITAAAGGVAGIVVEVFKAAGQAVEYLTNVSAEYQKTLRETSALTGQQGTELINTAASAKALADTFDQDVDEALGAANALSKELGITIPEAFDEIARGFAEGANASDEFLRNVREYSTQFREGTFSAKEFIDIAVLAQRQGIYDDKLLDSVKEFTVNIQEGTKAVKDSLQDAFGEEFTTSLFKNLDTGAITAKDALVKVSSAMQDTTIPASKLQGVLSTVFVGAGEDAGRRAIALFAQLGTEISNTAGETNQYVQYQIDLYNANKDAEESAFELANAFSSTSVDLQIAKARGREFINEVLIAFVRAAQLAEIKFKSFGAGVLEFLRTRSFKKAGEAADKEFTKQLIIFGEKEEAAEKIIEEQKARRDDVNRKSTVKRSTATGKEAAEALVKGSIAELEKRKSEVAAAIANTLSGSEAQQKLLVQQKEIEKLIIKAVEERNEAIRAIEIREELKTLQELEDIRSGGLVKAKVGEIKPKKAKDRAAEDFGLTLDPKIAKKAKDRAAEEYQTRLDQEAEFQAGMQELRQQGLQSAFDLINLFGERAAEKERERFAAIVTAQEESIARLEELAANTEGIQRKRLEAQIKSEQKILEQKRKDQEEAEAKAAKKAKARNLSIAIVEGFIAVQKGLAALPIPPYPLALAAGIFAATQIAGIAAQPLAKGGRVRKLSGQRINENPNITPLPNGDSVMAVLTPGEVVLNKRQQRMLGGDSTFRRLGIPGFADGGVVAAPNLQAVQSGINVNSGGDMSAVISTVLQAIDAVNSRIDRLRVILVADDIESDRQESESMKRLSIL